VAEIGVLLPTLQKEFLVRQPLIAVQASIFPRNNETARAVPQEQRTVYGDALVRLPSLRESKWKVTVLQRWIGVVARVEANHFFAVLSDATATQNPAEQVELDLREVSESDLSLVADGATFYWSIGYRDTPGGQRDRISTVRFARQPRLSKSEVKRIFEHADRSADFLERD
jgi:hypothetical protein